MSPALFCPKQGVNNYGRIVNVSSVMGSSVINHGEAGYSVSKAAMVGVSPNIRLHALGKSWHSHGDGCDDRLSRHPPRAYYVTGQIMIVEGRNCLQETKRI
jgi:3-oxoacyl-[acyl-carrier protein] reductase